MGHRNHFGRNRHGWNGNAGSRLPQWRSAAASLEGRSVVDDLPRAGRHVADARSFGCSDEFGI